MRFSESLVILTSMHINYLKFISYEFNLYLDFKKILNHDNLAAFFYYESYIGLVVK